MDYRPSRVPQSQVAKLGAFAPTVLDELPAVRAVGPRSPVRRRDSQVIGLVIGIVRLHFDPRAGDRPNSNRPILTGRQTPFAVLADGKRAGEIGARLGLPH